MISEAYLRYLYCTQNMSTRKIAALLNSNHCSVGQWLKKYGIDRRSKFIFFQSSEGRKMSSSRIAKAITKSREKYKTDPEHASAVRETLSNACANNWKNPDYVKKISKVSSATMAKTNSRKAKGEFPEWDKKHRASASERLRLSWASGHQRNLLKRTVDGFRSKLEKKFADLLDARGIAWEYEPRGFEIRLGDKTHTYTPDFHLTESDWWIEVKGFFWDEDARHRVVAFSEQYPDFQYTVLDAKFSTILGKRM